MNTFSEPTVGQWQRRFMATLFQALFTVRGRVNFTNIARFCSLSEQTFRRNFAKSFDGLGFNQAIIALLFTARKQALIAAIDCTFLPKSGKATYGLDRFWSGTANQTLRGLQASMLAGIHVDSGQASSAHAAQTPPGLSEEETEPAEGQARANRMDFYMRQLREGLDRLSDQIRYILADGYYANVRVFQTVSESRRHLITKLRSDANLRYLYEGPQSSGPGAPKQYDGKVCFADLSRFQELGPLEDNPNVSLYTQILNSPHLGRDLRVVVMVDTKADSYVVLACSDSELPAEKIVGFYRLQFQMELIFRDAKQHAGLTHCQARSAEKLDFHLNMSLAAINIARLRIANAPEEMSMNSFIRQAYNRWLAGRFLLKLGLKAQFDLTHPKVQQIIRMGSMDS